MSDDASFDASIASNRAVMDQVISEVAADMRAGKSEDALLAKLVWSFDRNPEGCSTAAALAVYRLAELEIEKTAAWRGPVRIPAMPTFLDRHAVPPEEDIMRTDGTLAISRVTVSPAIPGSSTFAATAAAYFGLHPELDPELTSLEFDQDHNVIAHVVIEGPPGMSLMPEWRRRAAELLAQYRAENGPQTPLSRP